MPIWEVELEDGRIAELESDNEPTERDVLSALGSYQPEDEPESAQFPAGLSEELARRQEYETNLRAYTGGSPMSPGGPDMDFARALYQEVPSKISEGIHTAMKPIEAVTRPVFQALRNATAPTNYGMTGEFLPELKPNESILHGLEPSAEDLGIIPSLRRAAAGMTTPGGLALLPIAGGGGVLAKVVQGGFAAGAAAAIPPSLEAMIQADTAAGKRGAATDVALSALFAGTMGRGLLKERKSNALQQEAARPVRDVQPVAEVSAPVAEAQVKKDFVLDPTKVFEKKPAKEVTAEESRLDEMAKLQTARDAGMLDDPFDLARLDRLEKKYGIKGLSAEDARYVVQEREGLSGVTIGGKQVGIEVVETAPAPSPDAPFSPPGSSPFTINPKTGNVVIIADRMAADRAQMRRRGLSESQINEAYKSDINEEVIHLGTDPKMALKYWENLSSVEKLINERRYGLGSKPQGMTPTLLGMEALRFRIQQASKMTPTEFTQMVRSERWTWEAITALEKTVRFAREKFTNLGKEQRQLFDTTLANLSAAKTAIQGGTPGSPRYERRPDPPIPESEFPPFPKPGNRLITIRREDGTTYRAGLDETQSWPQDVLPPGITSGKMVHRITLHEGKPWWSSGMLDPGETIVGESSATPSSPRRGPMSRRGEDAAKLAALRVAAAEGEAVPATEAGALRQSAYEGITPARVSEAVVQTIKNLPEVGEKDFRMVPESEGGKVVGYNVGRRTKTNLFDDIASALRVKFGQISNSQLRELSMDAVTSHIESAPGAEISKLVRRMGLVKRLVGGGKPGQRTLAAIPDVQLPDAPIPANKNPARLRAKAQAAILNEFFKQSEETRRPVSRKVIEVEELADPRTAKEPVFFDIQSSELGNPTMLGQRLTEDARVGGKDRNVEDSRRLVALLNKTTGAVDLVSIWDSGKTRAGVVVRHPGMSDGRTPLETVMKTHRPIHSILVDEPVRYFRKSYKSLAEFNREFGSDAKAASTRQYDIPMEGSESDMTTSGGTTGRRAIPGEFVQAEGAIRPSGSMAGPMAGATRMEMGIDPGEIGEGARLQNSEAGLAYDYARASKKEWLSPDDFQKVLEELEADAGQLEITRQSVPVVNALNKMFHSILERSPDMTPGLALEKLAVEFYENINNATKEQFVQRTLGRYGGEVSEAGAAGESVSPTSRELTGPAPGERISPGIPGVTGPVQARPRIEGVGGGLASTMARGTEVRRAAAEAAVPARAEAIRQEAMTPEEARFDQLVKNMGEMRDRVDAEIAAEPPEQVTPSSPRRKVFKEIEHDIDKAEAELVNQFIVGPGKSFAEWYSGWLTQNIRRNGGIRSGQAADIGNIVIDRTKQIYGDLTPTLNEALVLAGGTKEFPFLQQVPTPKQVAATIWLNRLSHPAGMDTAISRTFGALDGDFIPPRFVQDTVNAARAANLEIGGLILEHPQGKAQRNMTAWGFDIMMQGGKEFDIKVRADAKLNSTVETINEVEAGMRTMWSEWRDEMLKPTPDVNKLEKINQDFIRQWPNVVTHVKTQFGYQQVLHTDLHNYLKNSALRTAHVAAFREQFPNTEAGRARLRVMDEQVRRELGENSKDWDALIKTLQGRPTDTYNRFGPLAPGKAWSEFTRALNDTAVATARRMVLTGQMVTQAPETVIAPFVYFSPKNVIQSAIRFRELWPLMEKTGQINKLTYDFSIDPANPIRSAFRFGGNLLSKMYFEHFLNEFQGKWFAANATVAVERMRAGKMSAREMRDLKETFRQTGFTGEQATRMMEGDAELLGQFQRRMPAWAVGENRLLAEGSRLGANRLFNSIFRFQMYPMLKMNQFKMAMGRVIEARETGTKPERFAANKRLIELTFGTALQGAMLGVMAAYFFGGREGLKMKAMQAVDDPVDFMIESLLGAMSGPLYMVWSGARYGGLMGIGEQATRLAFPFSVGANLIEASAGVGQYKDMDAWDRIGKFLSHKTPGFRIMRTMLAEWALGEENPKLEANLKALSQWKRDVWKNKKFPEGPEHNRAFRIQMKKAVEAMIAEDMEARQKALDKALEIKINQGLAMKDAEQDVAASFQGRTVLKNPETNKALTGDEKDALIKRIGQDAFKRLEWFDNMLKDAGKNPSSVD